MKIRIGRKLILFGAKSKNEHRTKIKKIVEKATSEARRGSNASTPIDYNKEFEALRTFATVKPSFFSDPSFSARERVITVTSYLAEQLRWLITIKLVGGRGRFPSNSEMREIFEGNGPLGSFGKRISVAVVLGMISDDIKSDLRILKGIRNDMAAHSFKPMSFADEKISAECGKLKLCIPIDVKFPSDAEQKFVSSAILIMVSLSHVGYLLLEQANVLKENANRIIRNAAIRYNESAGGSLPKLDVPPDEP